MGCLPLPRGHIHVNNHYFQTSSLKPLGQSDHGVIFSIIVWDFGSSRAANSVVHCRISPNFELIQALMYIIVTCRYEMNPIKNVRENLITPFPPTVTLSVAMESIGRIWSNFELIQVLMRDPIKNRGENVMTSFHPL